jgi:hypothetical protein
MQKSYMNMRTHSKTDTISFANSFLLLVMVAGVLNIDLFGTDAVSGCHYKALYRTELVYNTQRSDTSPPLLYISEDIPKNNVVKDRILPSHFYATCFGTALFVIQNTGTVNNRPFYSSHEHTRFLTIPHQNLDEDEAFIFSVDVA